MADVAPDLAGQPDRLRWNARYEDGFEPATLLPAGFTVLGQQDLPDDRRGAKRSMLARRAAADAKETAQ
jgi:hypothetical protein